MEIADLNGSIGGIAGGKIFSEMIDLLGRWISDHEVRLIAQSCREVTSNKIFMSDFFRRRFGRFGFEILDLGDNGPETWTGENFFLNVLVDSEWWGKLPERNRKGIVNLINKMEKNYAVSFKGKQVDLFDYSGKIVRRFNTRAEVVNA